MNIIQDKFVIRGMVCTIETTDGGCPKHDTLRVTADGLVVTDIYGECSPLSAAYSCCQFFGVHGAARRSMLRKILRECVAHEIQAHEVYCLQQIEDGEIDAVTGEER